MSMNILGTLGAISLAAFFFTVPLVLKYHVYKPSVKHVIQGDVIMLERRVSSIWCQGVLLNSDTKFESYTYDSEPAVDETERVRTVSTHRAVLPNKAQEYWGFHLLRGTRVNISTCARLIGGDVTLVKGHSGLSQCLSEHKQKLEDDGAVEEDSISKSESDEDTSSISSSQGAIMNDTETLYVCKNSLSYAELPPSYRCSLLSHEFRTIRTMSVDIKETDYYYFIFSSKTYLEIIPNEFLIRFTIDRTHYDYSSSSNNCSSGFECNVRIALGVNNQVVVQIQGTNSTLKSEDLHIVCKPREWIFFIFYAAFLLIIFICAFQ